MTKPAAPAVYDANAMPWRETGKAGVWQKAVRSDRERGHFLGLIGMESFVRSGMHQHQGVATSFFLAGGLTDYQGAIRTHEVGINLAGATHDAIAYGRTEFVARLEAPVTYLPEETLHDLHTGARHARFSNPAPDVPPDINVPIDALARFSVCSGLTRQTIFDYAVTQDDRRMTQFHVRPDTVVPPLRSSALTELWVRGGRLAVNGRAVEANSFVVIEPECEFTLAAAFGALVIAWAEGPVAWADGDRARPDLFGFQFRGFQSRQ